jgi:hypothetical protein
MAMMKLVIIDLIIVLVNLRIHLNIIIYIYLGRIYIQMTISKRIDMWELHKIQSIGQMNIIV